LLKESHQMQEQLRHLTHQVLFAQEQERKVISRELHDDIAQTLTAINVHLATFTKEVTLNTQGLKQKIALTQRLVEKSVHIVHRFARDLRPTLLDDLGLIPALQSHLREFTARTRLPVAFTSFPGVEKLSSARRTVLYRVAQSALHNIAQHAHATRVKLILRQEKTTLCMVIHDNGRSFDLERVLYARRRPGARLRLGLLSMRERLEMVGGSFQIESAPGKGTTITARLPLVKSLAT
jgi:signal transduction histidine kinase